MIQGLGWLGQWRNQQNCSPQDTMNYAYKVFVLMTASWHFTACPLHYNYKRSCSMHASSCSSPVGRFVQLFSLIIILSHYMMQKFKAHVISWCGMLFIQSLSSSPKCLTNLWSTFFPNKMLCWLSHYISHFWNTIVWVLLLILYRSHSLNMYVALL